MVLNISLIIPTYNMAEHLPRLFNSLLSTGLLDLLTEVVFVNDGSSDNTENLLSKFSTHNKLRVKIVTLEKNCGRFVARWEGAKASIGEKILFLDTRLELESGFVDGLIDLVPKFNSIMGIVNIDTSTSIFSLYWDLTHKFLFKKHFADARRGFFLTSQNYDNYLKGTTVFLCMRSDFIDACEAFKDATVLSDDMAIMKILVEKTPIWVDSRLAIRWRPRENYPEFLSRLWERGPSFVEYHIFLRREGILFWMTIIFLIMLAFLFALLFIHPLFVVLSLFFILAAILFSVFAFARSPREALIVAPLHVLTTLTFALSVLRGILISLNRIFLGNFPKIIKK